MKKLGLTVSVATILAAGLAPSAVSAQDVVDWSGFYASVFGGYAVDREAAESSSVGPASLDALGIILNGSQSNSSGRINGLFGGVAGGYNYQHDRLVMGVEASGGLGNFSKTDNFNVDLSADLGGNLIDVYFDQTSVYDINWYTSLQGKLGLAHENWLFFLKGGAVIADVSVASTLDLLVEDPGGVLGGGPVPLAVPGNSTFSQVVVGPAFGFGAEVMMAENISLSAEYSYVGLPNVTAPAPGGILGGLLGDTTFTGGNHQIKAGVSYHF